MERFPILQNDPKAAYLARRGDIDAAVARVLERGFYVLGEETAAFEREFAATVNCRFGVGVGSGTDALALALRALDIGLGKAVATAAHTAVATVAAIELVGATPLLIDIDPCTFTINPAALERALANSMRDSLPIAAIMPVHLYGQAADLAAIGSLAGEYAIPIIEDCAQAHGAHFDSKPVGSVGAFGCFSFYPTKNLGAFGDGGMVTTNDEQLAKRVRALREYGWRTRRYVSEEPGVNSRLDELQAAILRVKLVHLATDNERRREIAARYDLGLSPFPVTTPVRNLRSDHVFHQYVIGCSERQSLRAALQEAGVNSNVHYPVPIHQQPAYQGRLVIPSEGLECAERVAAEVVSLPMYPQLRDEQVDYTVDAIRRWSVK